MNKKILIWIVVSIIAVGGLYVASGENIPIIGRSVVTWTASSTQYTLTTTSQQLVATTSRRAALTVQNFYCTAGGTVFLELTNPGAVAVVGTADYGVQASTTRDFTDNDLQPVANAIHGIVDVGTCTTTVTEWREAF